MTASSQDYRVTVTWDSARNMAFWWAIAPGSQWGRHLTLREVEMLAGDRPFPHRGLRGVAQKLAGIITRSRGVSHFDRWESRHPERVQSRVELWARREAYAWAKQHAFERNQRVLAEDEVLFDFVLGTLR
jgi:hypothetical protein